MGAFRRSAAGALAWRSGQLGVAAVAAALLFLVHSSFPFQQRQVLTANITVQSTQEEQSPFSLIVGMTHHKTGTSQMGCLLYYFSYEAGLVSPTYMDNGANVMDIAEYHSSTASSQWPAAFLTGHQLRQHCYARKASSGWTRCPTAFPCNSRMESVLGMGRCYLPLPAGPRTGYLHFVRNPLSVVVSAYLYHTQQPPPEDWIWRFNAIRYNRVLESKGVPKARLEQYKMTSSGGSASYGDVLRSLQPRSGVKLEFWRSVADLYAMARQYKILQSLPSAHQVRFEDLHKAFNTTVAGIAEGLYLAQDPQQLLDRVNREKCDPNTWSSEELAQHAHVTFAKQDSVSKVQLAEWLMEDAEIKQHLCKISEVLEYSDPRCSEQFAQPAEEAAEQQ